jgi:hypothetical protein
MTTVNGTPSVDPEFLLVLEQKYNIIDTIILKHYDNNFEQLKVHLSSLKKESFSPFDRIIVVQFDSDYYVDNEVGINLQNLFSVWQEVDMPNFVMLFYTCNFGIGKEIKKICRYDPPTDQPTVVETFFNVMNYHNDLIPQDPSMHIDDIEYHGLAIMGNNRSHRFALYNHIQNLGHKIAIAIKGKQ